MSFPTLRRLNALLNAFVNRPGKKWKLISESEAEPDAESESEEDEMRLKNATKRSTAPSTYVTLHYLKKSKRDRRFEGYQEYGE